MASSDETQQQQYCNLGPFVLETEELGTKHLNAIKVLRDLEVLNVVGNGALSLPSKYSTDSAEKAGWVRKSNFANTLLMTKIIRN